MRIALLRTFFVGSFCLCYFYLQNLILQGRVEPDTNNIDYKCNGQGHSYTETELQVEINQYKDSLKRANAMISDLRDKIAQHEKEKQVWSLKAATIDENDEDNLLSQGDPLTGNKEDNDICPLLSSRAFTASRLWNKFLPEIIKASRNPDLPELQTKENEEKMINLLKVVILPSRLRRSVRHIPTFNKSSIKHILDIVMKRLKDPGRSPPLRIAVFGGSVTIGRNCLGKPEYHNLACAWPRRFELLVNQIFQKDVVRVYNLGVGGTNSDTGTRMLKYWMFPEELKESGPDVIINSYSTNDSVPPWNVTKDQDLVNLILDQSRDRLQSFVREALHLRPCAYPPLVIHVDDWLGPIQTALLGELSYNTAMVQIAKWYDTFAISYADVVRDIVYTNTSDTTFFKEWDAHYGHWAHLTIAWTVCFASLELLSNFCDDNALQTDSKRIDPSSTPETSAPTNYPLYDHSHGRLPFLPPVLSRNLLLKNITNEWKSSIDDYAKNNATSIDCSNGDHNPCLSAWIAAPEHFGTYEINMFMLTYAKENHGWVVEKDTKDGWAQKVGLVATCHNASFTVKFENITKPLRVITIFYLKSYGSKWKDSRALVTVSNETSMMSSHDLSGEHDLNYSLTYSERIELQRSLEKGSNVNLKVQVKMGNTFKIMGLMFCSY